MIKGLKAIKQGQVALLYEGDEWLSNDSMVLMGVFTDTEKLSDAIHQWYEDRERDLWKEEQYDWLDTDEMHERSQGEDLENYIRDCKACMRNSILGEFKNGTCQTQGHYVNVNIVYADLNEYGEI